jgi:hypothetical protein
MEIIFQSEICAKSIVIVLTDIEILNWNNAQYDSYYTFEIRELDSEKKVANKTILDKMCWENSLLSRELFRAWASKQSQELNILPGSWDNNFGLSLISTLSYARLFFELGTGAQFYDPFPYGIAYFQELEWEELRCLSYDVFMMELKGLVKSYNKMLAEESVRKDDIKRRIDAALEVSRQYEDINWQNFVHPGDMMELILKYVKEDKK